ncbi:DMT family transporter [Plastorhodobacter daqingensis]|uniref:DMT family transporter n=1 Tax=Plastorhodobacter daqingensis TaxID=1387281 RepID=A0ABW2UI04_9RHOB
MMTVRDATGRVSAALGGLSDPARGHLAMLGFAVMVAGSFSLGALAANLIAPAAINAARFAIAAALLGVLCLAGPGLHRSQFHAPWRYLVLGGLFAAYFVLMFEGLKTAPPVATSAVFTLTPLMTALFGYLLLRQVLSWRMVLGLAVGAFGALWVIFRGEMSALFGFHVGRGEAIYFLGCAAHALFTPMLRLLNRGEPALVSTFAVMSGGFLLLLVWGWADLRATDWLALPLIVWVTLIYVAVFASAMTFFLLQYAAMRLPSAKVMAYTYLVPSFVILWEVALGNSLPSGLVLPGVVMSAVALMILLKDEGVRGPRV